MRCSTSDEKSGKFLSDKSWDHFTALRDPRCAEVSGENCRIERERLAKIHREEEERRKTYNRAAMERADEESQRREMIDKQNKALRDSLFGWSWADF